LQLHVWREQDADAADESESILPPLDRKTNSQYGFFCMMAAMGLGAGSQALDRRTH